MQNQNCLSQNVKQEDVVRWFVFVSGGSSVGGLDEEVDEKILLASFIPFGEVKEVTIPLDAGTGKKRGFGFVEFEEADDAAEARANMNSTQSLLSIMMQTRNCLARSSMWATRSR